MLGRFVLALPVLLAASDYAPRTVKAPAGRYLGFKQVGTDPYNYESLELILTVRGSATLTWARRDQTDERERRRLPLSDLHLDEAGFAATVKGDRPPTVPARLEGRFVIKGPGNDAKGPLEPGILFNGDWFLQEAND
jgi:hypothetical protein